MILCLDIGNTNIYAGVLDESGVCLRFRYPTEKAACTSDLFGVFLLDVLREHAIQPESIVAISACSVVPALDYSIRSACVKYLSCDPLFLVPGVKAGVKLALKNSQTLGADRLATAAAASSRYPERSLILLDFGTATTVCAVRSDKTYLGGAILPGIKTCMEALCQKTAKLSAVTIVDDPLALGKTTEENIQSGLYYGQLGATMMLVDRYQETVFKDEPALVIATGGYAHLFQEEGLFDYLEPDLVLYGLELIWQKNQ